MLDGRRFEEFLYDIVESLGYTQLQREANANDIEVDLLATPPESESTHSGRWAFEAKAGKQRISSKMLNTSAYAKALSGQVSQFVFACSAPPTNEARDLLARTVPGVQVWDPDHLLRLAPDYVIKKHLGGQPVTYLRDQQLTRERAESLATSLDATRPGNADWVSYQRLVTDTMQFLLAPPLEAPLEELTDADGRNRRDLIMENAAPDGFWARIRTVYDAHYIVIDAKNSCEPLDKDPILDVAHYLKPHGCGMFGIIVCRKGAGIAAEHAVKEQWIGGRKMIVILNDQDIKKMLHLKAEANDPEELLRRKIADFRMSL